MALDQWVGPKKNWVGRGFHMKLRLSGLIGTPAMYGALFLTTEDIREQDLGERTSMDLCLYKLSWEALSCRNSGMHA
jgi:hypothetical protein